MNNNIKTREEFKAYCLRSLGDGVIEVNVSDAQVEDRIDEAIQFCQEFLYEGSTMTYYKYALTDTDFTNRYITLPDDIISVTDVLYNTSYIGNVLNNVFKLSTISMINNINTPTTTISNFYFSKLNLATLNAILNAFSPTRFSYSTGKLFIDLDWSTTFTNTDTKNILIKCYVSIDPETNTRFWDNIFLKRYTIALIQKQWGKNLSKYNGITLPGGTQLDSKNIIDEANKELDSLKEEIMNFEANPKVIVA